MRCRLITSSLRTSVLGMSLSATTIRNWTESASALTSGQSSLYLCCSCTVRCPSALRDTTCIRDCQRYGALLFLNHLLSSTLLSSPLLSSTLLSSSVLSCLLFCSPLLSSPVLYSALLSAPVFCSALLSCLLLSCPLLSFSPISTPVLSCPLLCSLLHSTFFLLVFLSSLIPFFLTSFFLSSSYLCFVMFNALAN